MRDNISSSARSRNPLAPHEVLDAYWFAQMLIERALWVATEAGCTSTIGRRLESALGRAIRYIVDAADGTPAKANERLVRARTAIQRALSHFDELCFRRGVREDIVADLRERASLLMERLDMLKSEEVAKWPASNCLSTVLEEVTADVKSTEGVNVIAAISKVPAAAIRELPTPVLAKEFRARRSATRDMAGSPLDDGRGKKVPEPMT